VGKIPLDVREFFTNPNSYLFEQLRYEKRQGKIIKAIGSDSELVIWALEFVRKSIKYYSDKGQFGVDELWLMPHETSELARGDCEDGAILLANILVNLGIPAWRVRLSYMAHHLYVLYYSDLTMRWLKLDWTNISDQQPKACPLETAMFSWTRDQAYTHVPLPENTDRISVKDGKISFESNT